MAVIRSLGPGVVEVVFGTEPSPALSRRLGGLAKALLACPDVQDVCAGLVSLAIWSEADDDWEALVADDHSVGAATLGQVEHRITVRYDGEDLDPIAEQLSLSREELISLHASGVYTVGAVGFVPGFPYLLGLPKGLAIPRRSSPRPRVPAGSVAIAGGMAGIYPRVTPGGWWLLGTCAADRLPEFAVGDAVRFEIEP